MDNLLIVFMKNPELGRVKTRLAAVVGDKKALDIYQKLITKTKKEVFNVDADLMVCYSDRPMKADSWKNGHFYKEIQEGDDLGMRMHHAIFSGVSMGYCNICLIGTDIYDLTTDIISQAFNLLKNHDMVIGPAHDGGYYLIGMKKSYPVLFDKIPWSTPEVLEKTIAIAKAEGIRYARLSMLNDIDEYKDITGEAAKYLL